MAVAQGSERRGGVRREDAAPLRGPHAVHDVATVSLPAVLGRFAVASGRKGWQAFASARRGGHLVRAGFEEGGRLRGVPTQPVDAARDERARRCGRDVAPRETRGIPSRGADARRGRHCAEPRETLLGRGLKIAL